MAASVSASLAAASLTACMTSRSVNSGEMAIGTVFCVKGATVMVRRELVSSWSKIGPMRQEREYTLI
jgi:hypothetical protein